MNKAALVDFVANKTGMTKKDASGAIDAVVSAVVDTVSKGKSVTLTNFGTFVAVKRRATVKRNPKTGEKVNVKEKNVPKFRPGKSFKEAVAK
jgi:DNA-binding protein HU-beta